MSTNVNYFHLDWFQAVKTSYTYSFYVSAGTRSRVGGSPSWTPGSSKTRGATSVSPSTSSAPSHQTPPNYSLDVSMCTGFWQSEHFVIFGQKSESTEMAELLQLLVLLCWLTYQCFAINKFGSVTSLRPFSENNSECTEMIELLWLMVLLCWLTWDFKQSLSFVVKGYICFLHKLHVHCIRFKVLMCCRPAVVFASPARRRSSQGKRGLPYSLSRTFLLSR